MIDAREYLRRDSDGTGGAGWTAWGAFLGWLAVGLLALVLVAAARLGTWAQEAGTGSDCRTGEAMAALAERRAINPDACPAVVFPTVWELITFEAAE
jgi:hypothetical protein